MKEVITVIQNLSFSNLDLLSVGITIAAIALLGFIVYISNTKSISNISFLLFSAVTIVWSFFNYISYQTTEPYLSLFFLRAVIFLAFWHSFTFFQFLYVFPKEKYEFPRWYTYMLLPYMGIVSLFTLFGSFVFSSVLDEVSSNGRHVPVVEKGIILFTVTVIALLVAGFTIFIKKISKAEIKERSPYIIILTGAILTFAMLFSFNLILPAVFLVTRFIPLGAICIFPFVLFTSYAIFKHKTFKVKSLLPIIFAFFLCMSTFVEIIFADTAAVLFLRVGIFLFTLLISIQFIKNILRLEVLNDQKSEFISFASHEIRTPITVMKGYADLMVDEDDTEISQKNKDLAKKIMIAGNDVTSLISQYLNKSKMELGQLQYTFSVLDITSLVKEVFSNFKINAEERGLTFTLSGEESPLFVSGDQGKLKEVIGNLIDNSLKYTKEGNVEVSVSRKEHTVLVSIKDTGVGISKETIAGLFQEFGRADSEKVNILGTGLGLYLAKIFIEAHGGKVWVESDGVGKGSQFYVELQEVNDEDGAKQNSTTSVAN